MTSFRPSRAPIEKASRYSFAACCAAGLALFGLVACGSRGHGAESAAQARAIEPTRSDIEPTLGRIESASSTTPRAEASVRALEVPGFLPAQLFSPAGHELRPLVVAAHGAGGSPEWECDYWRKLTRDFAFLLCLRGAAMGSYEGYYYSDHHALEREFLAAVKAAREVEPRIAEGSGLYTGFSQGATMGSAMIARHGAQFPFLSLIEGFEQWDVARARAFARVGGRRVLIACGSAACERVARVSARWLEQAGLEVRVANARGEGHTALGRVAARVGDALPWLLGGDPLWQTFAARPEAARLMSPRVRGSPSLDAPG